MKSRIFKSILYTVIILTIAYCVLFYVIPCQSDDCNFAEYFTKTASAVFFFAAAVIAVGAVFAYFISESIVKPIENMDFGGRSSNEYPELEHIVKFMQEQRRRIRDQREESIAKQTEFETITKNMSEGMIIIDNHADIMFFNNFAAEILNIHLEAPRSIIGLNDSITFRTAILNALHGKNGYDVIRTKEIYYSVLATPVFHDEIMYGAVIFILDETEKESREKLRREFTSNVSHELKTPLTSILGFAELIKDGMATGEDARHFADNIHKEANRLITLVGDIIKLSRLDDGEISYDNEKINLMNIVTSVSERLSSLAEKNGVSISVDGETVYISGNSGILEEMVYNLCDNAIKYNRRGGKVIITVGGGECPFVCVEDNGIGIPTDYQERVFERFYRVDKSHSKEIGGTGLGLSIVKRGALYHKAHIDLESHENKGTKIKIIFNENLT